MAQQLDLQEQEQVDALKAFWARYGNLIMWTVTLLLAAFAGWNLWQKQQRDKALQASTMYGDLKTARNPSHALPPMTCSADAAVRAPPLSA